MALCGCRVGDIACWTTIINFKYYFILWYNHNTCSTSSLVVLYPHPASTNWANFEGILCSMEGKRYASKVSILLQTKPALMTEHGMSQKFPGTLFEISMTSVSAGMQEIYDLNKLWSHFLNYYNFYDQCHHHLDSNRPSCIQGWEFAPWGQMEAVKASEVIK